MSETKGIENGDAPRSCDPRELDLAVGGQAVIEGVMMRSPTALATAVRVPDGRVVIRKKPFRSIVRKLRGTVRIESAPGTGTTVIVTMPLHDGMDALVEPPTDDLTLERVVPSAAWMQRAD